MTATEFKMTLSKHITNLFESWFSDKPLIKGFANTILQANINKYDNVIEMLTDENGNVMVEELINNLNLKDGYQIDLTTISPLLPKRIVFVTKEDIDNLLNEFR